MTTTTTAIIGLGNMGKGLARRLAGRTDLVVATRGRAAATAFAATLSGHVAALSAEDAVARAGIVMVALPYGLAQDFCSATDLSGKVVVDMSNPLKPDFSGLLFGHTTSAAEQLQSLAPAARVVKAYNTIFSALLDLPADRTAQVPVFLAGDDAAAVDAVAHLVTLSSFAVERTGGLEAARLVEQLGMLNVRLGYSLGRGTGIAPAFIKV